MARKRYQYHEVVARAKSQPACFIHILLQKVFILIFPVPLREGEYQAVSDTASRKGVFYPRAGYLIPVLKRMKPT